jgi:deoxyribonuclease V
MKPQQRAEWEAIQRQKLQQLWIPATGEGFLPQSQSLICTLDVQYFGQQAACAAQVQRLNGEELGIFTAVYPAEVPYYPSFFAFREGPILCQHIAAAAAHFNAHFDLCLIDGHGIAHPLKMGVATWVGIELGIPTVGCAKDSRLPYAGELGIERGCNLPIYLEQEQVGWALRSNKSIKPIFVSPGQGLSLSASLKVVEWVLGEFRIPEPLRKADQAVRCLAESLEK